MVQQYLDHCKAIITHKRSNFKGGSKESGLISLFGYQNEYDLREGFPLLTTKDMKIDSIVHELIWFLQGGTNIKYLEDNKCSIWRADTFQHNLPDMIKEGIFPEGMKKYSPDWDKAMKEFGQRIREDEDFAERWGEAGPIYGRQWRKWGYHDKETGEQKQLDQLGRVLNNMRKNPIGKKHLVSAWNPVDVPEMSLPPCHVMYQMTANEQGELELQLYQRSCDQFLGVPFNIASYAMLTQIIAQELNLTPKTFIHTFGDSHFYTGPEARAQWYKENIGELQTKLKYVSHKEDYLPILEWVKRSAPENGLDEKYDHVTAVLEQLSREPKALPKLEIVKKPFDQLKFEDFKISEYNPHPAINRKMSV
jgi:thymidylate synthase